MAVVAIILLTVQSPEGTVHFSETLRNWFGRIGIESDFHSFRSNAHIVEYFILGFILALFGSKMSWKPPMLMLIGSGIGLIDECLKIILPTREFDFVDLVKDCLGIIAAVALVQIIQKSRKKDKSLDESNT